MTVTKESPHHLEHAGRSYHFCSARCQAKFAAEPAKFQAQPDGHPATVALPARDAGTIYTCPMHPEIRQDHPGNCPKCGMTLEPVMPSVEETENPELVDFQRRFWWTLPLTVIVTVLADVRPPLRLVRHRPAELDRAGTHAADSAMGRLVLHRRRNSRPRCRSIRFIGARESCASATICTICARTVAEPTCSERITSTKR